MWLHTLSETICIPHNPCAGWHGYIIQIQRPRRRRKKKGLIKWSNLILWASVFAFAGIWAALPKTPELLPIRLFENFYRNGSLPLVVVKAWRPCCTPSLCACQPTRANFAERKPFLKNEEFPYGICRCSICARPMFHSVVTLALFLCGSLVWWPNFYWAFVSAVAIFSAGTF